MGLKIVCSGYIVRYPLVGQSLHHLQYLVGLRRMGHEVVYFEDYGWPNSCYDPSSNAMTGDPSYGLRYLKYLLEPHGLGESWCYLAEDGTAHGMPREQLAQACRECDAYLNLSNINWIPELELCRRRVLVDTDPVFTQIGGFGMGGSFSRHHALFTYGANVHLPGCAMPEGGARWLPTRQPVVPDLWPVSEQPVGDDSAPFTTVMNWSAYGDREHGGVVYGQKDREFEPFFALPRESGEPMEIAVNAPAEVRARLSENGWRLADPGEVTRTLENYHKYLQGSRGEFSVAKHAYVSTRSGWFSDRSCGYLAMGRPVVLQDTGFSRYLPCGEGLLAFGSPEEALAALRRVAEDYPAQCRAARELVSQHFEAADVLADLMEHSL